MLDLNKPMRLTDGSTPRILCTDAEKEWPIVGLTELTGQRGNRLVAFRAQLSGEIMGFSQVKLENAPEPTSATASNHPIRLL